MNASRSANPTAPLSRRGSVATPEPPASPEPGTVLGPKAPGVPGHARGAEASVAGDPVGQIGSLRRHVQPAVERTPGRGLQEAAREKKLTEGVYGLATTIVTMPDA